LGNIPADTLHIDSLVRDCVQGKSAAQYAIYGMYNKAMFSTAKRIMGQQEEAEDALQEAFIDAFQKIASFKMEATFGSWLKTIVINKCLTKLRSKKMEFESIDTNFDLKDSIEDDDFEATSETIISIKNALESLSNGYRVIVSLHLFEGYDHGEIAEILHINEVTSRTQFKRGKAKLLEILKTKNIFYKDEY
jgi:RNA polymerase sigma factor (sigma-70 family)